MKVNSAYKVYSPFTVVLKHYLNFAELKHIGLIKARLVVTAIIVSVTQVYMFFFIFIFSEVTTLLWYGANLGFNLAQEKATTHFLR